MIDPLDGTINFLFGVPVFAVSVACEDHEGTVVGVVLDPVLEETFAATRSGEATLNGAGISGGSREDLATALVATGGQKLFCFRLLGFSNDFDHIDENDDALVLDCGALQGPEPETRRGSGDQRTSRAVC